METLSDYDLTLSQLKAKLAAARFSSTVGRSDEISDGGLEASRGEEAKVLEDFCKLGIELGKTGLDDIMQVHVIDVGCGDDAKNTYVKKGEDPVIMQNTQAGGILGLDELINDINAYDTSKPIANIKSKDLEEASECKFGKSIAQTECVQGVRQNDSMGKTLINDGIPKSNLANGAKSYVSAVTRKEVGDKGVVNFSAKSSMVLEYTPYVRGEGMPSIHMKPEPNAMEKWRKCLVGYFLGAKLPYQVVRREILKKWSKEGLKKMTFTDTGFYLFDFENVESRDKILDEGLFHIFGRVMVLKAWHLMMSLLKENCEKIPIWVNFHNLPYEYWTAKSLGDIASIIGRPLFVDQATEHQLRISYARVCIEVDAKEERVENIKVLNGGQCVEVGVKYQWYPPRCGECKVFGHSIHSCSEKEAWVNKGNLRAQEHNKPKKQDVWKKVRSGALTSKGRNGKENSNNSSLKLSNAFDIMLNCEDSDTHDALGGKFEFHTGMSSEGEPTVLQQSFSREKTQLQNAVSDRSQTQDQSAVSAVFTAKTISCSHDSGFSVVKNSGLHGCYGHKDKSPKAKKLRGEKEIVEKPISCVGCDNVTSHVSNLELVVDLDENLSTKEKGNSDMNSPTTKGGLSISDYPSDWSKGRIKKAIRAMQLAGPPKTKDDPP